jgi:hypothetical protein
MCKAAAKLYCDEIFYFENFKLLPVCLNCIKKREEKRIKLRKLTLTVYNVNCTMAEVCAFVRLKVVVSNCSGAEGYRLLIHNINIHQSSCSLSILEDRQVGSYMSNAFV